MLSYFENAIHNWNPSLQKDVHQCYTMYTYVEVIVLPCTLSPFLYAMFMPHGSMIFWLLLNKL